MIKLGSLNSQNLPLLIEPNSDATSNSLIETAINRRELFHQQLLRFGALLLRGFQLGDINEFEKFARIFSNRKPFNYAGGVSPRIALNQGVYTSTEYPAELTLSLHNELSYSNSYPRQLFFGCSIAPQIGGATTLGDSRRILHGIDRKTVDLFKRKKLCYVRNLHSETGSGYSWQDAFETDDKKTVEKICGQIGADFEWKSHGILCLKQIRPATIVHPITGEEAWFNQADGFHSSNLDQETLEQFGEDGLRLNVCFGDGSPIDSALLAPIRRVIEKETIPHKWQAGDILIVDNILAAHGRTPFQGARKIILTMT